MSVVARKRVEYLGANWKSVSKLALLLGDMVHHSESCMITTCKTPFKSTYIYHAQHDDHPVESCLFIGPLEPSDPNISSDIFQAQTDFRFNANSLTLRLKTKADCFDISEVFREDATEGILCDMEQQRWSGEDHSHFPYGHAICQEQPRRKCSCD